MIILLLITTAIIVLYLLYPVYLMLCPEYKFPVHKHTGREDPVSLILLTCDGILYIREKIELLYRELASFHEYEFIVIDDNSADGTREVLESLKEIYQFKLVLKNERRGIPHSMNLGVKMARYEFLIFSDQRQKINGNILREIIRPLQNYEVGAVSGYISCHDSGNHRSFLRNHENFIKKCESRTGNLVGVYGPLYAIKKSCYQEIGESIILDDLYLSLQILNGKRIVLMECCKITDDDFMSLYNLKRTKRYLQGLIQILMKKNLLVNLPFKITILLLWHKYLRLLIPPLVVLCYLAAGFHSHLNVAVAVIFLITVCIFLISFITRKMILFLNLNSLIRINIYYFISMIFITIQSIFNKARLTFRPKKI